MNLQTVKLLLLHFCQSFFKVANSLNHNVKSMDFALLD